MASYKPIVLVEDNRHDVELTLFALKRLHVINEIVVLRDGVEACDYLFAKGSYSDRNPDKTPQLVLLDLQLPKVGGLQVLTLLRADPRTKTTPVVVFTSSAEEQDLITSYRLGANSFIRKPVEIGAFLASVRQLGLYWTESNEAPPGIPRSEDSEPIYRGL